ncbi:MAG: ATP-binding cassette domain-containing protein, partial [Treponema sp.]|nr:ATP-binding cassette domain-containing protein [Treponema sp.]
STVRDELAFGPENLGVEPDEIEGRVARALEETGLFPYSDTPPADLSGGQKQLLAIAAALVMEPRILVLDEPTSQLDPWAAAEVLALISRIRIARIQKRGGLTVIMATHNGEEAAEFADKICVLDEGKLAAYGSPREIFRNDELIRNAYIRRPDVSELSAYLSGHGRPLPLFPINIDEARDSIEAQAAIEAQNAIPGRSGV